LRLVLLPELESNNSKIFFSAGNENACVISPPRFQSVGSLAAKVSFLRFCSPRVKQVGILVGFASFFDQRSTWIWKMHLKSRLNFPRNERSFERPNYQPFAGEIFFCGPPRLCQIFGCLSSFKKAHKILLGFLGQTI
jgi:hypothetical protein